MTALTCAIILAAGVTVAVSQAVGSAGSGAAGDAVAAGRNDDGQAVGFRPQVSGSIIAVDGGGAHALALRSDGQIVAAGDDSLQQGDVPALPTGRTYVGMAAGDWHSLFVRDDGVVLASGDDTYHQSTVPQAPSGDSFVAVAAGAAHSLALTSQGKVLAWGDDSSGQTDVPTLPTGVRYTAIAAGGFHSLALRSDGAITAFGRNDEGQATVPALTGGETFTAIAAGGSHSLALRSDGFIVGFGRAAEGQIAPPTAGAGRTYTAIAAGDEHSVALRSDGATVAFGSEIDGSLSLPPLAEGTRYVAVAAGSGTSFAIVGEQARVATKTILTPGTLQVARATAFTLTASVSAPDTVAAGEVELRNGTQVLVAAPVVNGKADLRVASGLPAGSYDLTAHYLGSPTLSPSASAATKVTVSNTVGPIELPKATVKANVPAKVGVGSRVSVSVTVTAQGKPVAGGAVEVRAGTVWLASATLTGNAAQVRLPASVSARTQKLKLTVSYLGSDAVRPGNTRVTLAIQKAKTKLTVKAKKRVKVGARAAIRVVATSRGNASGKVTFRVGKKIVKSVKVRQGKSKRVKLPAKVTRKAGKTKVTVTFGGSNGAAKASKRITIKVVR